MNIEFIENNGNGIEWYFVDSRVVGLCYDGRLIDEDGACFDCVDVESVAERNEIINAILEFKNENF